MYAVIEACGKQYKVSEGDIVFFEKLDIEEGKKVSFDNVILVSDGKEVQVGNPYVKGFKVEGKVVSHGKDKKIIVFKMKAKKNYRRKQGHRQPYTKVEITSIKGATTKVENKEEKPAVKKEGTVKKEVVKKTETTKATITKKVTEKKTATKKETVAK